MATTLAQQLQRIAATSVNTVSAEKQKALHSVSLLYSPSHAAAQDFDTIYSIAIEGFRELVELDGRFARFEKGIFSEISKGIDRFVQTKQENEELNANIDDFLGLVGGKLLVKGALKALEWLVRRFRIHEQNTTSLILAFLPYHSHQIFPRLLSIIPEKYLPQALSFLAPHLKPPTSPPRSSIVKSLTAHPDFFNLFTSHIITIVERNQAHHALISLYITATVETLNRLCSTSVYRKHPEDIVTKVMPLLVQGLKAKKTPEFQIGCYMIVTILAAKLPLDDTLLDSIMAEVVQGWTSEGLSPALACLALLAQKKREVILPDQAIRGLVEVEDLDQKLVKMGETYKVDRFATGIAIGILGRLDKIGLLGFKMAQRILLDVELSGPKQTLVLKRLLEVASKGQVEGEEVKNAIAEFLTELGEEAPTSSLGKIYGSVLGSKDIDVEMLELRLQTVLRPISTEDTATEVPLITNEPAKAPKEDTKIAFENALSTLPTSTSEISFLSPDASSLFPQLSQVFLYATMCSGEEINRLFSHSLFASKPANEAFTLSFLVKVWTSKHPVLARAAALSQAKEIVSSSRSSMRVDYQALIPYILLALGGSNKKIRAEAANLFVAVAANLKHVESGRKKEKSSSAAKFWGFDTIFGKGTKETSEVKWMETSEARKVLKGLGVSNSLEEILLDAGVVKKLIAQELSKAGSELKNSLKSTAMAFLSSHISGITDFGIRLDLLQMVNLVRGGPGARARNLLQLITAWVEVKDYNVHVKKCAKDKVRIADIEEALVRTVGESDRGEGLDFLVKIAKGDFGKTPEEIGGMREAVCLHLQNIWPGLKTEARPLVADGLLSIATHPDSSDDTTAGEAMDALRHMDIPLEIFEKWLGESLVALKSWTAKLGRGSAGAAGTTGSPDTKKRKTGRKDAPYPFESETDTELVEKVVNRLTTVLELLESQTINEEAVRILKSGFGILSEVMNVTNEIGVGIAYLLQLIFGILGSIVNHIKTSSNPKRDLDGSVRADVLVNCIRSTNSPQVQNRALLLVAALADVAPDVVLHSVMPIFTFMGANVLRQDDEYSAYVIEQTVQRVVPPLVKSLQGSGAPASANVIGGVADLVANFVTAYKHIPTHRRLRLFVKLTETLGADDFLFVVIAMLAEKYFEPGKANGKVSPLDGRQVIGKEDEFVGFCKHVSGAFNEETQLASIVRYLDLVIDLLKPSPQGLSRHVFELKGVTPEAKVGTATKLLHMLASVLDNEKLRVHVGRKLRGGIDTERLRGQFSVAMEHILAISDIYNEGPIGEAVALVLENLLNLLSTPEFVNVVESLITKPESKFRRSALASFTDRLNSESKSDSASRTAVLSLAPKVASIITSLASPIELKSDALSCINVITAKYGKRDPGTISNLAEAVIGEGGLQNKDEGLRILALVCLTDLTTCLGGRIVPIIPKTVPFALGLLEEERNALVHNAVFALLEKLVETIPSFMTSYLPRILKGTFTSAATAGQDSNSSSNSSSRDSDSEDEDHGDMELASAEFTAEVRNGLLSALAEKIDLKNVMTALLSTWPDAVSKGYLAIKSHLLTVKKVVEVGKKSQIQKMADLLGGFFMGAFDLRVSGTIGDEEDLEELEQLCRDVALQMVYKLNDTIFKPMFSRFLDWAADELRDSDPEGRALRLIVFYKYLITLNGTLKSLITEYYSIVLSTTLSILTDTLTNLTRPFPPNSPHLTLYTAVLTSLTTSFTHDDRSFWHNPVHTITLTPLLTSHLLTLPPHLPLTALTTYLLPTLTHLGLASPTEETHRSIHSSILKAMRSPEPATRLVAVKTEMAFYEELGEEWMGFLPETVPYVAELLEDDEEGVEREVQRLIGRVESVVGGGVLEGMLGGR